MTSSAHFMSQLVPPHMPSTLSSWRHSVSYCFSQTMRSVNCHFCTYRLLLHCFDCFSFNSHTNRLSQSNFVIETKKKTYFSCQMLSMNNDIGNSSSSLLLPVRSFPDCDFRMHVVGIFSTESDWERYGLIFVRICRHIRVKRRPLLPLPFNDTDDEWIKGILWTSHVQWIFDLELSHTHTWSNSLSKASVRCSFIIFSRTHHSLSLSPRSTIEKGTMMNMIDSSVAYTTTPTNLKLIVYCYNSVTIANEYLLPWSEDIYTYLVRTQVYRDIQSHSVNCCALTTFKLRRRGVMSSFNLMMLFFFIIITNFIFHSLCSRRNYVNTSAYNNNNKHIVFSFHRVIQMTMMTILHYMRLSRDVHTHDYILKYIHVFFFWLQYTNGSSNHEIVYIRFEEIDERTININGFVCSTCK